MRIGQFVSLGIGGADRASQSLVQAFVELGMDVVVFYNKQSIPQLCSMHEPGTIILSRLDAFKKMGVKLVYIENVSEMNDYHIDILGTHRSGNDFSLLPRFEETNFSFPIVETNFHGLMKTKADYRIFPSEAMIGHMSQKPVKYTVIPNPIMRPVTNDNMRKTLGINDKFVFGRIGRPTADIYSPINLRAYKMIENKSTLFLYVAPCAKAKSDAKALGISNIIFLEQVIDDYDISRIYNTFNVLCHSNGLGETFGNTVAEAMIHGKPVVSFVSNSSWAQAQVEVIGRDDLLVRQSKQVKQEKPHPRLGRFGKTIISRRWRPIPAPIPAVPDMIDKQYAEIMRRLRDDKHYYTTVSHYCKQRADSLYDYRVVAGRYIEIYQKIIKERK